MRTIYSLTWMLVPVVVVFFQLFFDLSRVEDMGCVTAILIAMHGQMTLLLYSPKEKPEDYDSE